jgi:hypothetical protein
MPPVDFRAKLREQLDFIASSCARFDKGHTHEAQRIATAIRVIGHDRRGARSLLTHLNARSSTHLLSSIAGPEHFPNAPAGLKPISQLPLGTIVVTPDGVRHSTEFDANGLCQQLTVDDWWDEVVWRYSPDICLTRKLLVLTATEKDGGAHVDATLGPEYEVLASAPFSGFIQIVSDDSSLKEMHRRQMRVVGREILGSVGLLALANDAQTATS